MKRIATVWIALMVGVLGTMACGEKKPAESPGASGTSTSTEAAPTASESAAPSAS